ncbi:MAG TPA: alpha-D-ribose 1-methylphosphonate 5-triphosphate diphosphatase [Spirochaetia bacterium]|nr:alpha-D-ribose 1-methylphosphonate 5-triphosphate diphosphatase [Spirochaetia bacterium]
MKETVFTDVRIVTPEAVLEQGMLVIRDGRIASLSNLRSPAPPPEGATLIEGQNRLLMPGFVDLHNDGIEQEIEPRPRAVFPLAVAFQSLESQLVSHGVTTIFHSFSFMDGREGTLNPDVLEPTVRELNALRRTGVIRHLVHARYEMVEVHHYDRFCRLIDGRLVNLVSLMDHTPGQGQYRNPDHLVSYYVRKYNTPMGEIQSILRERERKAQNPAVGETLRKLSAYARNAGLPIASHDDDTPEKVARMSGLGVTISEFPVDMSAAHAASRTGMHVVVGAPNVLRGKSTSDNLSAREAIVGNTVDILCSDYYTPALLPAVFRIAREGLASLPDAVRMVSTNPARAAGLSSELGSLEVGKRADLIMVNDAAEPPTVVGVWVGGHRVFEKHDSALNAMGDQWAREISPAREASHAS